MQIKFINKYYNNFLISLLKIYKNFLSKNIIKRYFIIKLKII